MNRRFVAIAFAISLAAALLAPQFGAEPLRYDALLAGDQAEWNILVQFRISRTILAWLAGGSLALAGAIFQALLRNSLATPYTLGVSSGAALGAVIAICFRFPFVWFAALVGAVLTLTTVLGLASRKRVLTPHALILAGVSVASICSALITVLFSFAGFSQSFSVISWLIGGVEAMSFRVLLLFALAVIPVWGLLIWQAPAWNLLAFGDVWAGTRGVPVRKLTLWGYLAGSWLAALTVSLTGPIGFIGLLIPHVIREISGTDHRTLLPASVAGGAAFLTCCDAVGRTVLSPADVPAGVVTALLGGPGLIWILHREESQGGE